jgi:hypothetical protein
MKSNLANCEPLIGRRSRLSQLAVLRFDILLRDLDGRAGLLWRLDNLLGASVSMNPDRDL